MSLSTGCPDWAEEVVEGLARVCVPRRELFLREDGVYEPSWAPVFYNPVMALNRDLSVLVLTVFSRGSRLRRASDLMAATGVRGVRMGLEVSSLEEVYMNDADPRACLLITLNIERNRLVEKARVFCEDVNTLSRALGRSGLKIDFVDIDPYGSPAPYIDSALDVVRRGGLLSVTATDIASLVGTYPGKTLRRYGSSVVKTDFFRETGLRVLVRYIQERGVARDLVLRPVLSVYVDHYYKVVFSIDRGAEKSLLLTREWGFYKYCPRCLYREAVPAREVFEREVYENRCPVCGSRTHLLGPLWLGSLWDRETVSRLVETSRETTWLSSRERLQKILSVIHEESLVETPYYYRTVSLASVMKRDAPPLASVIECLERQGYRVSRTHMDPVGLRTDAPYRDVAGCVSGKS